MWGWAILTAVIVVLVALWLAAIWLLLTGSLPFGSNWGNRDKSKLEAYISSMVLRGARFQ